MNTYTQHTSPRMFLRCLRRRACEILCIIQCLSLGSPMALAASAWDPTLLVNTEAFQTIDDKDSSANIQLRFGQTLLQSITYDRVRNVFAFSSGIRVLGTMSGTALVVDRNANIGGNLSVTGSILAGSTFAGAGLSDCTGGNKLLWNTATQQFECGIDQTGEGGGASFGSGNVLFLGDERYVRLAGGTMTGNMIVRALLSGSALRISAGGADIHGPVNASGAIRTDGNLTLNDDRTTAADALLTFGNATANQTLKFTHAKQKFEFSAGVNVLGTLSGSALVVDRNANIGGTLAASGSFKIDGGTIVADAILNRVGVNTLAPKTTFETVGTVSGAVIHASSHMHSSGSLIVEGAMSGATLEGANLKDCDTAATSKLLWDVTTKKFSCGTDQTGGGGSSPPWSGVLHAALADGNSVYAVRAMETLNTVAGPTPTNIGTTVARCVGYRSQYAITVNRVRLFGVGATTNLYKFAVYPRGTGAARLWESGTVTSAANAWLSISAATPFSLSANTDYWFCVTVVNTGTTAGFRSPPAPIATNQFGADAMPLGTRTMGLPVYVQFAVTAGAFPATLPAVAAAAYAAGTTGSVPFAFFDNSSS